ncbi:MAG: hypothetical protein RLY86_938 [Pseudomonadota bacterium]|jgi:AcrR family transcriptional regulator
MDGADSGEDGIGGEIGVCRESRVRQTPKSIATRRRVVEAAIACFIDIGYHRTNTAEIAKRANLTRGAVQYYFPTTAEVLSCTAEHIAAGFLTEFEQRLSAVPPKADAIDSAIDVLWEICRGPLWTAWLELMAAARTDAELRAVLDPVQERFTERQAEIARAIYAPYLAADPRLFDLTRLISWHVLQAVAAARLGGPPAAEEQAKQALVADLKRLMHAVWSLPQGSGAGAVPRAFWS